MKANVRQSRLVQNRFHVRVGAVRRQRHFDARNGVLQVRRTLHNRKLGVDMLGKTKTRSGERTIVLPRSTAEILRRRKENAITQWIFPDPVRPELPLSPNCAYTHMKANLPHTVLLQNQRKMLCEISGLHKFTDLVDIDITGVFFAIGTPA